MIDCNTDIAKCMEALAKLQDSPVRIVHFEAGNNMCRQGKRISLVHIIRQGLVRAYHTEENTRQYILEFYGVGETLGEEEAILGGLTYTNTAEALTPVQTFVIPIGWFRRLLLEDVSFCYMILKEVTRRMVNSTNRASFQSAYPSIYPFRRLQHLIKQQQLPITKQDMADYLGIDIRSLNRLLWSQTHCP